MAQIPHEDQLNTIKLTLEAERRLGIATAPVEVRPVERLRSYGGEIALPTGAAIIVSAPVGGTLQAAGKTVPPVGAKLAAKQPVFLLLPMLSPERSVLTPAERIRFAEAKNTVAQSQIDAAGQVRQRQAEVAQRHAVWQQLQIRAQLKAEAAIDRYERARQAIVESGEFSESLPDELKRLERQFLAGEVDFLRVVTARTSLIQARRAHLDLLNEAAQAAVAVTATGGLPPESILRLKSSKRP